MTRLRITSPRCSLGHEGRELELADVPAHVNVAPLLEAGHVTVVDQHDDPDPEE